MKNITRFAAMFFWTWVIIGGLVILAWQGMPRVERTEAPAVEVQEWDCLPSHEPTGYGPEDSY